jgi:casein kinase I family protein HRR25
VKTSTYDRGCSPLQHEYSILNELQGAPGIPDVIWQGTESQSDVVVFKNLGPTLSDIFQAAGKKLPVSAVALLAEQLASSITQMSRLNTF